MIITLFFYFYTVFLLIEEKRHKGNLIISKKPVFNTKEKVVAGDCIKKKINYRLLLQMFFIAKNV